MANTYGKAVLTGGASDALDGVDGANLSDKDRAIVMVQGTGVYFYMLDDDSGVAESSPDAITPDNNAGNKRWILHSFIGGAVASNVYSGASTFAGPSGVVVTIGATLGGTDYQVAATPTADSEDVGAIYITTKTTTTFTVHCTGSGTPTFDWVLRDAN